MINREQLEAARELDPEYDAMEQSWKAALEYYFCISRELDNEYGVGYAKNNPELVGKLCEVAAKDLQSQINLGIVYVDSHGRFRDI